MKFEDIFKLCQKHLKNELYKELKKLGYQPQNHKGFLYAEGDLPVLLVGHLDTVHKQSPRIICYSMDSRYISSPQGLGGDDRNSVFMILEIIKTHKCHVLWTEDEEIGIVGGLLFSKSNIKPNVNYIIELDRKGKNDAVFYDDCNTEFQQFILSFGFQLEYGSFSDISLISPALKISSVNLSAGYYNPHTLNEYIDMVVMKENIERVKQIVSTNTPLFTYVERPLSSFEYGDEVNLMCVDDGFVKLPGGHIYEGYDFYIDKENQLYEYDWNVGFAVEVEGQAFNKTGLPLKFQSAKSEPITILNEENQYEFEY